MRIRHVLWGKEDLKNSAPFLIFHPIRPYLISSAHKLFASKSRGKYDLHRRKFNVLFSLETYRYFFRRVITVHTTYEKYIYLTGKWVGGIFCYFRNFLRNEDKPIGGFLPAEKVQVFPPLTFAEFFCSILIDFTRLPAQHTYIFLNYF